MRRVPFHTMVACFIGAQLGLPTPARGQTDQHAATPSKEVIPPRLVRALEPTWPAAESWREGVSVLFELTVNPGGHVEQPTVVESAGTAFDSAAALALAQFEFAPARQGTNAIATRIRLRVPFRNAPEPTLPPEDSATDSATQAAPNAGPRPESSEQPAGAPAGIQPSAPSVPKPTEPTPAPTASETPPDAEPLSEDSYVAVAQITAPPREVTRRTVEQQDLTKIPGTSGDALRAIEVMPGVARTSISSGDPILRGAAWNESSAYIEGTTVPLLYHFGGVKSAFNSRLLSRVDLYPGNFGTSYGRVVGGVISAKSRDPARDRFHAVAEASVIDSMALVETPIGKNAAVAIAARRSNIDFFYDTFAPKSSFNVVAAPVYYDYQGLGRFDLHPRHTLRILSYGSRDALKLVFANPSNFDPSLRGQVDFAIAYHRVQTSLESRWSERLTQRVQATYGYTTMRQMIGTVRAELYQHEFWSRAEWNYRASDALRVNAGYDLVFLSMQGYYIGPRPPQAEGEVMNGGMSTEKVIDVSDLNRINALRPAGYVELEWRPAAPLLIVPGIRVDHYGDQGALTVDPRLSSRIDLSQRFSLKWGIGRYSQNPQYYELIRNFGNPSLRPYHAVHYSSGFEHRPTDALYWGIEGFYKWMYNRVVSTPGGQPPAFLNDGVGRVYGAELFARYTGTRLRAWLAYTLSRSERQDRRDPWRLFEQDQTHILAATANYQLGRGWEAGARFRLTSGNPYTPVRSAVYDANVDVYRPVNAAPFSARNPLFHQLDIRIEKLWRFTEWQLAAYLDVQNVYNASNNQGYDYSYNFQQREGIAGLPLTPNLGLRGEI